jgi:hypothetical protein
MLDMAGPALTSLPPDVRKRFEEEKARLAAAKANPPTAPTAPAAPEASRLEKRQELGSILKQFARDEVKVDPEQMVKIGADIGVSRGQLSGLYKKYRSEFEAEAPEGSAPALAKMSQEANKQTPVAATAAENRLFTPNLDNLSQMQNKPIGSSSALTRYDKNTGQPIRGVQGAVGGLETRPSGTQIGGRRSSLPKEMQNIAAANLYRAEQELLLQNEQIALDREEQRARIDAFLKMNKPPEDGETKQMPYFIK